MGQHESQRQAAITASSGLLVWGLGIEPRALRACKASVLLPGIQAQPWC